MLKKNCPSQRQLRERNNFQVELMPVSGSRSIRLQNSENSVFQPENSEQVLQTKESAFKKRKKTQFQNIALSEEDLELRRRLNQTEKEFNKGLAATNAPAFVKKVLAKTNLKQFTVQKVEWAAQLILKSSQSAQKALAEADAVTALKTWVTLLKEWNHPAKTAHALKLVSQTIHTFQGECDNARMQSNQGNRLAVAEPSTLSKRKRKQTAFWTHQTLEERNAESVSKPKKNISMFKFPSRSSRCITCIIAHRVCDQKRPICTPCNNKNRQCGYPSHARGSKISNLKLKPKQPASAPCNDKNRLCSNSSHAPGSNISILKSKQETVKIRGSRCITCINAHRVCDQKRPICTPCNDKNRVCSYLDNAPVLKISNLKTKQVSALNPADVPPITASPTADRQVPDQSLIITVSATKAMPRSGPSPSPSSSTSSSRTSEPAVKRFTDFRTRMICKSASATSGPSSQLQPEKGVSKDHYNGDAAESPPDQLISSSKGDAKTMGACKKMKAGTTTKPQSQTLLTAPMRTRPRKVQPDEHTSGGQSVAATEKTYKRRAACSSGGPQNFVKKSASDDLTDHSKLKLKLRKLSRTDDLSADCANLVRYEILTSQRDFKKMLSFHKIANKTTFFCEPSNPCRYKHDTPKKKVSIQPAKTKKQTAPVLGVCSTSTEQNEAPICDSATIVQISPEVPFSEEASIGGTSITRQKPPEVPVSGASICDIKTTMQPPQDIPFSGVNIESEAIDTLPNSSKETGQFEILTDQVVDADFGDEENTRVLSESEGTMLHFTEGKDGRADAVEEWNIPESAFTESDVEQGCKEFATNKQGCDHDNGLQSLGEEDSCDYDISSTQLVPEPNQCVALCDEQALISGDSMHSVTPCTILLPERPLKIEEVPFEEVVLQFEDVVHQNTPVEEVVLQFERWRLGEPQPVQTQIPPENQEATFMPLSLENHNVVPYTDNELEHVPPTAASPFVGPDMSQSHEEVDGELWYLKGQNSSDGQAATNIKESKLLPPTSHQLQKRRGRPSLKSTSASIQQDGAQPVCKIRKVTLIVKESRQQLSSLLTEPNQKRPSKKRYSDEEWELDRKRQAERDRDNLKLDLPSTTVNIEQRAEPENIAGLEHFREKGPTDIRVLLKEREAAAAKANPAHSSKEDQIQGSATVRSSLPRAVISFNPGPKQGFSKQLEGVGSYRRTRSDTRQSGDMHSELSSQQSQKQPIQEHNYTSEYVLKLECDKCNMTHEYDGRTALAPFIRLHGLKLIQIPKDGDCFYHCIAMALRGEPFHEHVEVSEMRRWVSAALTEDQLTFYRLLAQTRPDADWLEFARNGRNSVKNLEELKEYALREGNQEGSQACLWADSFAHSIIAEKLDLSLLFVDMERMRGAWPYRLLAESGHPKRYIIMKREGPIGHFVLISTVEGQACFPANELPQIFRKLWKLTDQPIP